MKTMNTFKLSMKTLLSLSFFLCMMSCQGNAQDASSKETKKKLPSSSIQEAAYFGNDQVIKEYIEAQLDLNQKDEYGSTPLHIAATFNRTSAAELLISGGANINATSADGSTPLHTAAFFGRVEIVKALLAKGAPTDAKNNYGATALESVSAPFEQMKPFYDQISKSLGPLGLKLDYEQLQKNRITIAEMIAAKSN